MGRLTMPAFTPARADGGDRNQAEAPAFDAPAKDVHRG